VGERFDFTAVGLTILDILGRPVDRIPAGGGVQIIEEIRMTPAGTAAGPAVTAARLGLRARLVGAIGDDEMGSVLEVGLRRRGVDTEVLQRVEGVRTSATMLTVRSNGDRPALHAPGASLMLALEPEDDERVLDTRFLHLGGVGALPRLDGPPTSRLLEQAKARGVTVTCDLIAPGEATRAALESALPHVDYFMPTLEEALEISGAETPLAAAAFFRACGVRTCIFKCGAEGSLLVRESNALTIPAYRVDVVDTTGCGDAYAAGFAAGLGRGFDEEKACRFASAVAALVATGLGSDAGAASAEEALRAMQELPVWE
jgi:sugar/nucleoside kinase (ribokinase family)